jgi:hypothetical protein
MSKKIHAIIEYIKANELFNLDAMDLFDKHMNAYDVLDNLGIKELFNESEEALFMEEMERLAHQNQTAEIVSSLIFS